MSFPTHTVEDLSFPTHTVEDLSFPTHTVEDLSFPTHTVEDLSFPTHEFDKLVYSKIMSFCDFKTLQRIRLVSKTFKDLSKPYFATVFPGIDWLMVSNAFISESFIDEFKEYIRWTNINIRLSEQFIRDHIEYIDWYHIPRCDFSDDFLLEFKDKIFWPHLIGNLELQEEVLEKLVVYFNDECFEKISWMRDLGKGFILKYKDRLNWSALSYININFTDKTFLLENHQVVVWQQVLRWKHLDEDFIEENAEIIGWDNISLSPCLTPEFIWKHKDKLTRTLEIDRVLDEYKTGVSWKAIIAGGLVGGLVAHILFSWNFIK